MSRRPALRISPRASADLSDITAYIARHNPARAASFLDELEERCDAIAVAPDIYPLRPELADGIRMAVHGRTLIFYRHLAADDVVRIERVLHGARDVSSPLRA